METAFNQSFTQKASNRITKALGVNTKDAKLSLTFFTVSFIALFIGGVLGLLQGLERAGLLDLPYWLDYYKVLTGHGIVLVLVFTATFVVGYFYAGISHTMGGLLPKVRKMRSEERRVGKESRYE